jgi:hypothetical protein
MPIMRSTIFKIACSRGFSSGLGFAFPLAGVALTAALLTLRLPHIG